MQTKTLTIKNSKNLKHESRLTQSVYTPSLLNNLSKSYSYSRNLRKNTVAVVGLGYVGLPLSILASKKGYSVIGVDNDREKIDLLKRRISPFKDEDIEMDLTNIKIRFRYDPKIIEEAGIVIVCVPTPVHENHTPDLGPLVSASKTVAEHLLPNTLVIIESTVNPGVCESVVLPILEKGSGLIAGKDFGLSHCPERVNPGDKEWKLSTINRVVGSLTERGLEQTLEFYRSIISPEKITPMKSIKEAEAVKIVENSFRDINIAFVNELAMSFSKMGIDIVNVINGSATKPFAFMAHYPGCGVGGHCIPVDPYYLIEDAKRYGFDHKLLRAGREINNHMPKFTADLLDTAITEKKLFKEFTKVGILGASYKANTDDLRESPSFEIYKELKEIGLNADIYDPYTKRFNQKSLEEFLKDKTAVIVATAHKEFLNLSPKFFHSLGVKIVIDGRNCLNKEEFINSQITYKGIGR